MKCGQDSHRVSRVGLGRRQVQSEANGDCAERKPTSDVRSLIDGPRLPKNQATNCARQSASLLPSFRRFCSEDHDQPIKWLSWTWLWYGKNSVRKAVSSAHPSSGITWRLQQDDKRLRLGNQTRPRCSFSLLHRQARHIQSRRARFHAVLDKQTPSVARVSCTRLGASVRPCHISGYLPGNASVGV